MSETKDLQEVQQEQKQENKWQKIITTYLANTNTNLNKTQLEEFIMLCKTFNLNPLKREIYAIVRSEYDKNLQKYIEKLTVVTNYYEYLKRADATGLLSGYNVEIDLKSGIGKFTGYRKDWKIPLTMTFFLDEWKQLKKDGSPMGLWASKPYFMFEKCIIANGLRRLFPNELGNMPYINEELWYQNQQNEAVIKEHMALEQKEVQEPKIDLKEIKKVVG